MDTEKIRKILRIFLKVVAIFMFFYWGITQLLFPIEYHALIGVEEYNPSSNYDLFIANLTGALVVGFAYAAWLAAEDPIKNTNLIRVLFVTGALVIFVYIYNLQFRGLSPVNWIDAAVLSVLLLILIAIYPWKETEKKD